MRVCGRSKFFHGPDFASGKNHAPGSSFAFVFTLRSPYLLEISLFEDGNFDGPMFTIGSHTIGFSHASASTRLFVRECVASIRGSYIGVVMATTMWKTLIKGTVFDALTQSRHMLIGFPILFSGPIMFLVFHPLPANWLATQCGSVEALHLATFHRVVFLAWFGCSAHASTWL